MSIIHDALKKVQQGLNGLNAKTDETPVNPAPTAQNTSANIFENPPPVQDLPEIVQTTELKPPIQHKIKSALALLCAMAITAGSIFYIYKQFQNDIPMAQRFIKKSFYKLIHKEEVPAFKTKAPEDLKPLAQLTINAPGTKVSAAATPPAPTTLNIHGIMSNASGNLVLINDHVYQEGDDVDGAKIVKINLDSITVINNGTEQTISVKD